MAGSDAALKGAVAAVDLRATDKWRTRFLSSVRRPEVDGYHDHGYARLLF